MINPNLPGLKAVGQDGKTKASELWKVVIGGTEDQYQNRVSLAPAGPVLVYDLENDGPLSDSGFHQERARRRQEAPRHLRRAHGPAAGRNCPTPRCWRPTTWTATASRNCYSVAGTELHIAQLEGGESANGLAGGRRAARAAPAADRGRPRLTAAAVPPRGNVTVWREKAGSARFLLRFPDGVRSLSPRERRSGQGQGRSRTHEALGNAAPRAKAGGPAWSGTGRNSITSVNGKEVYRYVPPAPTTYLAPPPLVADLAGKRRILVRDFGGQLSALLARGQEGPRLPEEPVRRRRTFSSTSRGKAGAAGLRRGRRRQERRRGDGRRRQGPCRPASSLTETASEKRRLELLPGMTAMSRGPTGRLGPGQGRWILLRHVGEGPRPQAPRAASWPTTGERASNSGSATTTATTARTRSSFAPHFPSAVLDYDGDGHRRLARLFRELLRHHQRQGQQGSGRPRGALRRGAGTLDGLHVPCWACRKAKAKPVVFHHSAYALALVTDLEGRPLWHFGMTRDTAGTWGQFVDLDGDGRREVLHAQPDGVLRCFTVGTSASAHLPGRHAARARNAALAVRHGPPGQPA